MCRLIFNRSQVFAGGMTLKRTKRAFVLFAKKKPKKEKEHKKGKGHKKDKSKKAKKAKKDKVMSIILCASNLSALLFMPICPGGLFYVPKGKKKNLWD